MKENRIEKIRLEEIPSTNDYAKARRGEGKDLLVTAKRQTGGRGTKGRSFSSEEGGVYLSLLRFYRDFPAADAFQIMAGAAVAVCDTLRLYGLTPSIKWPNDVFVNGKKICGILIENTLAGERISSSVVGVGLNVWNELPQELQPIATTVAVETGKRLSVEEVSERLYEGLLRPFDLQKYREYLGFIGQEVTLIFESERIPATLLSVTDRGELEVKTQGEYRKLCTGEVSVWIW